MVFDEWQNGISVAFIVIGKNQESDLDLVLQALSKHIPKNWMFNVIFINNVQAKINVLRFDCPKSTYNSMFINCVLYAYFVVEQNSVVDHSLLHNIFCHKLCLFCRILVSIQTCFIHVCFTFTYTLLNYYKN
jgi:hypothetical protein